MDINYAYSGDHSTVHTNIESLCCIPETNIRQLALNLKKKKKKTSFFPVFFLVTCNEPSFLVSGWDALMFFAEDQCYSLWGKH